MPRIKRYKKEEAKSIRSNSTWWLHIPELNLQNTRQPALDYLQITLVAGRGFEPAVRPVRDSLNQAMHSLLSRWDSLLIRDFSL